MKSLLKITVVASAALALTSTAAYADSSSHKKIAANPLPKNQVELLYYQSAKEGRISVHPTKKGCYALTLFDLTPNVIYFSNYPSHVSGRMSLNKYNTTCQHAEKTDGITPNAVIHAYKSKNFSEPSSATNMTVVLSDFNYNQSNKTMSYTACPLNKEEEFTIATGSLSLSLYNVDLFIDPFKPWPP